MPLTILTSLLILAYTNVVNHWFSMFQQSCPAKPIPSTISQNFQPTVPCFLLPISLLFIVFKSDDYVAKSSEAARLVKGVLTGQFALKSFVNFVRAIGIGNKLTKHYKNFPTNIQDFDKWRTKAIKLWKKAGSMADTVTDAD